MNTLLQITAVEMAQIIGIIFLVLSFILCLRLAFQLVGSTASISWIFIGLALLGLIWMSIYQILQQRYDISVIFYKQEYPLLIVSILILLAVLIMSLAIKKAIPAKKAKQSAYKKIVDRDTK